MQQLVSAPVRRQFARKPVKVNAFVYCRGRFQRAKVIDYSHGGLQLEGTFGLVKRDSIQVELISGIRVQGTVAWSLGTQTGVRFGAPLAADHPAIVELSRRLLVLDNNRAHPRFRARLDGRLLSLDGRCNFKCIIMTVSEGGARISVANLHLIPGKAFLFVANTGDIYECDIRSQRGDEIDVRFIDSAVGSQRKTLLKLVELEPIR
jgi:hypothetical protein